MTLEERALELRRDFKAVTDVDSLHAWMVRWRVWLDDAADFFLPQVLGL
jgi:hypothetical protein